MPEGLVRASSQWLRLTVARFAYIEESIMEQILHAMRSWLALVSRWQERQSRSLYCNSKMGPVDCEFGHDHSSRHSYPISLAKHLPQFACLHMPLQI
jgi:hypothetical protein